MCWWQYSTPETSCWNIVRARGSDSRPFETMKSKSSPPGTNSITM